MTDDAVFTQKSSFSKLAQEAFSFLMTDYQFRLSQANREASEFSRPPVRVLLTWEWSSQTVFLEVANTDSGQTYSLPEILAALVPEEGLRVPSASHDAESMKHTLETFSRLCRQYLEPLLVNDVLTFKTVDAKSQETRKHTMLEYRYGDLLLQAREAWERKDWATALRLYVEAEPAVDSAEYRRLSYLRKRREVE